MQDKLPLPELVLASISPRRRLLLEQIGARFRLIPPTAEEVIPDDDCAATALLNAGMKALSVLEEAGDSPVIGADTIVDLDGKPLGKPRNAADAAHILALLSGRRHIVHTGVQLHDPHTGRIYSGVEHSQVWFRTLGDAEIEAYIRTGEPLDKAGAYGIQERGALLIERIDGCFFNVMGLPLARLWGMLKQMMADRGTPLEGW
jgi:septum formation protein